MGYDKIIRHGQVVLPEQVISIDIGIKDGKIVALGKGLEHAEEEIDATGMYVLPGVIDAHVHLCEPGRTEWEGFETGTKALAAGGTTCYVDMPLNNLPATIDRDTIRIKKDYAKNKNYVDYALYGGLVPHNLGKLHELVDEGAAAYKCFVATCGFDVPGDFKNVDDYSLYKGMLELKEHNQILSIHCENASICDGLAQEAIAQGKKDMRSYLDSRPIFAEVEAVRRVLYLGKVTGCKLHFVHLSCTEAVNEVLAAKAGGMDVTIETCPHYLNLSDEDCVDIGPCAKCSPPIRSKSEAEKMWERVLAGQIDIITSDHSPCPPDMKYNEDNNIFQSWGGLSACQNVLDMMFDEAVQKRGMNICKLMNMLSIKPAEIFGLSNKGGIILGKDADLVLLKANDPYTLEKKNLYYKHKQSVYVGKTIGCKVIQTFVRGELVYSREKGIIGKPIGIFNPRNEI